jgi:ribosomal protein RSM22 (predicted rRNA methylase)
MPATLAAIGRALAATADRAPGFAPASHLDVGAGTGASAWAATAVWPSLTRLDLVDREPAMVALGRRLAAGEAAPLATAAWQTGVLGGGDLPPADLVTAAYVLGEVPATGADALVARLWAATTGVLILVEPGSKAGFERIRAARSALIAAGGHVVAPCPGDEPCPLAGPAWCHVLARLDRSPLQRSAKRAERSWEDEPFSYVAVARGRADGAADPAPRVVLGRPRHRPGLVELRICVDGRIETRTLSRRDGPAYRIARDLAWGDPLPEPLRSGRRGPVRPRPEDR